MGKVFLVVWISTMGFGEGGGITMHEMPNMAVCQQVQEQILDKNDWKGLMWHGTQDRNRESPSKELKRMQPSIIGTKCIQTRKVEKESP